MLDTLGTEIANDRQRKGLESWDPINGMDPKSHRNAISFNGFTGAKGLLAFRLSLEGKRFSSKSQLQEVMEDASYQALIDYVTVYGAYNDTNTRPNPGDVGPHSNIVPVDEQKEGTGQRARININLVSRPVLVAAIAPLCGRRHVYKVTSLAQTMEGGSGAAFDAYKKPGIPNGFTQQEDTKFDVREGWLYVGPFGSAGHLQRAEALADWIIANRPFLSYADFQDRVRQSWDRVNNNVGLTSTDLDPDKCLPPATYQAPAADPKLPGARYFAPDPSQPRYDIRGIEVEPYFRQLVRDAGFATRLANFNTGFAVNTAVPNTATNFCVDKANLCMPADADWSAPPTGGAVLHSRQTFEFCFETQGTYEITSLGQIRRNFNELVAQEKLLTVVRLPGRSGTTRSGTSSATARSTRRRARASPRSRTRGASSARPARQGRPTTRTRAATRSRRGTGAASRSTRARSSRTAPARRTTCRRGWPTRSASAPRSSRRSSSSTRRAPARTSGRP
jgi:hypothetical protein